MMRRNWRIALGLMALAILPAQSTSDDRVTLAGLDVKPFTVDRTYTLAAGMQLRNNVRFAGGGRVDVAAGQSVMFVGEVTSEPRQQIFGGEGAVQLYAQRTPVHGEWWGAVGWNSAVDSGPAFRKADAALVNGGIIQPLAAPYYLGCSGQAASITLTGPHPKSLRGLDRNKSVFFPMVNCSQFVIKANLPNGGDITDISIFGGALKTTDYQVSGIHCEVCSKLTIRDVRTFGLKHPFWGESFGGSNFARWDSTNHTGTIRFGGGAANENGRQNVAIVNISEVNSFPAHNVGQCMTFDSGTSELRADRVVGAGGTECVQVVNTSSGGHRPEGIRLSMPNLDASPGGNLVVRAAASLDVFDGEIGQTSIPNDDVNPASGVLLAGAAPEDVDGVKINGTKFRGAGRYGLSVSSACNVRIINNEFHANGNTFAGGAGIYLGRACGSIDIIGNQSGVTDRPGAVWGNASGTQPWGLVISEAIVPEEYTPVSADGVQRYFRTRLFVVGNPFGGNVNGSIWDGSSVPSQFKTISTNQP